jgi:hypothetical protein
MIGLRICLDPARTSKLGLIVAGRQRWLHYQSSPSPILPQVPGLTGDRPNAGAAALRLALDEKLTLKIRIWRRNLTRRLLPSDFRVLASI